MFRSISYAIALTTALPAQGSNLLQTLISTGGVWKYDDNGANPGASWATEGFNDSTWLSGSSELGFGDDDEATTLTKVRNGVNIRTAYFRKQLNVAPTAEGTVFRFRVKRDDGVVVYLNGDEVYRNNMPTGAITYETTASTVIGGDDENRYFTFSLPATAFDDGQNTLAAEVHQFNETSSDISFDLILEEFTVSTNIPGLITNPATMDLDGNGLPDIWEGIYQAQDLSPNADSDGDGLKNRVEASFGTDPFNPNDRVFMRIENQADGEVLVCWNARPLQPGQLEVSSDLGGNSTWLGNFTSPDFNNGEFQVPINIDENRQFFRVRNQDIDTDDDGVPDWIENELGSDSSGNGSANSTGQPISYDTDGNGTPDVTLSGDLARLNEVFGQSLTPNRPTRAQAARFLMQAGFGAKNLSEIDNVVSLGFEGWIDQQTALPPTYTNPYIVTIKDDFENNRNNPALAGYCKNNGGFVCGNNTMTAWARSVINGDDQLRQRVAFALSQIFVAARDNQSNALTNYYDQFLDEAFGNYEDLMNQVSRHPIMGHWLSHLGNKKAGGGQFPDENYAREIMQLFSIGLWELNLDGSRKLLNGEPIPTYGNIEITNLARVFTGVHYNSNRFGNGYRDDDIFMTTPMKIFSSQHDFDSKIVPIGVNTAGERQYHTLPERIGNDRNDANALKDVTDTIYQLVRHPNTAPFVSRQLIQFLVTSNPTPEYVARVASKFRNNGSGEVGDMEAVVRAILLDDEARNPIHHLQTEHFGQLREPVIRLMHHARVSKIGRHSNLLWWDYGQHRDATLQQPMNSPTVFNFYRPDYRHPGEISQKGLDSPVFGITNSYTAISFPNRLWNQVDDGFKFGNRYSYGADYSDDVAIAGDIPALLDRLSLIYCGGTLTARSREIITTVLASTNNLTERARLAHYSVLMSPEGACLK